MFYWFLPQSNANQPQLYTYPLPTEPPSPSSIPPLEVITVDKAGLPVLDSNFLPALYVTHGTVYMRMLLSPFIPLFLSLTVSTSPFSTSASPFLPRK